MQSVIAVDIGGTHARFAVARVAAGRVVDLAPEMTLATAAHADFDTALRAFLATLTEPVPRLLALAVAGPVGGAEVRPTNNDWVLQRAVPGFDDVMIINDFDAVGHAVAQAGEDQFVHLCGPDLPLPETGTISIIGPGTGLGIAHIWRGAGDYRVQPTEGAHGDYAPTDAVEDAILARLRLRFGRVSVERVASGPGIVDIHAVLAGGAEGLDDRALWTRGFAGSDRAAVAAVERFCAILGGVAGDVALVQGASAVVIAGGLGLKLREMLPQSDFAARFCAKGRFSDIMAAMPVKLITHPQPGLFGAAAAFARWQGNDSG
jgi:glucokinase